MVYFYVGKYGIKVTPCGKGVGVENPPDFSKYRLTKEWYRKHPVILDYLKSLSPEPTNPLAGLRKSRGQSLSDMGRHMGLSKQAVGAIEKRFEDESLTLSSMRKYLDGLDYTFDIVFKPKH